MNEQTPLLRDTTATKQPSCCSSGGKRPIQKSACCSFKNDGVVSCCSSKKGRTTCSSGLPPVNEDDYCYLAEQKWEYKFIALMCAIFLAGKMRILFKFSIAS